MTGGSRSKRALRRDRHWGGDRRRVAPRVSLRDSVRVVLPVMGRGKSYLPNKEEKQRLVSEQPLKRLWKRLTDQKLLSNLHGRDFTRFLEYLMSELFNKPFSQ